MYFIFEDDDIPSPCFSTTAEPAPVDESNLYFSSTIDFLSPKSIPSTILQNRGIDCFQNKSIEIVVEKTQFIFPFTSAL